MALTLQIKRSTGSTAPSSLADGELAYTHGNEKFYIGDGSTVKLIGGKAYNDLIDHTTGTLTAGSAILVDSNKAIDDFIVGNNSTTGGSMKFKEGTSNGTDHVALKAPNSLGASVTFTLPNADGSASQFLQTNGSGELSFADAVSAEAVEDITAAQLVTNGSHTRLTATYDDAGDGAIDLVVDNDLANYSNTSSGFLTAETNDLSAAVVWANVPNANITQGSVTQHQAALSIATTQLTGTITNAQLAGSITNAKLVNSSVTIGSDTVSLGGTQTDLNGITSLDVDNITVDANTISTTDTNGDLVLSPDGTATVTVPSGYEARAGFGSDSLVNKSYVDSVANGLDVKASVRVATTADLSATYSNGAGTLTATANGAISIDGVTLSANDRVLVKDQTNQVENGFYKVTNTGGASAAFVLTRTPDANDADELTGGAFTFVEQGSTNADNGYVAVHNGTPTIGTDDIEFEQFSGAGQIDAGNGLTKSGNTIDAVGTANRITVTADAIDIASTYVGQSSITTLGTIGTGVWQGDSIANAYIDEDLTINGGTIDATPIGSTTTSSGAFTTLAASGQVTATATTETSSTSTGAMVVSGGVGIAKSLQVGVNITGAGASTSTLDGFNIDGGTY